MFLLLKSDIHVRSEFDGQRSFLIDWITKVLKSLNNCNNKHSSKEIVFLKIIAKEIAFLKLKNKFTYFGTIRESLFEKYYLVN